MTDKRFADELVDVPVAAPAAGFLLVSVGAAVANQVSPLQSLYQQIYQQAVAANQPARIRDLFAVMN